ncbi:glycosyltransferase family 4 protein [Vibrio mytili]|nr:glycosyltransferase family 4 protein [Vibrio mytili]
MSKNILYIHHSPVFGGASRSLLEMIKAFPSHEVEPYFICTKGSASEQFITVSNKICSTFGISCFDHTRFGHYTGRRWFILLREILFIFPTLFVFAKAFFKWRKIKFTAIHVNDLVLLPAVLISKFLFKAPIVLHSRCLFENKKGVFRLWLIKKIVDKNVDVIVAIDSDCHKDIKDFFCSKSIVIHNGLCVYDNKITDEKSDDDFIVGFVGNMLPSKGIYELAGAAVKLKELGHDDIVFLIVGPKVNNNVSLRSKALDYFGFRELTSEKIDKVITDNNLDNIVFSGFCTDIEEQYKKMSVLAFPSRLNAVGRPVFEAAYYRVPSIVAVDNPTYDTFIPDVTGLQIKQNDINDLVEKILKLKNDHEFLQELGEGAFSMTEKFYNINNNAKKMLSVYDNL